MRSAIFSTLFFFTVASSAVAQSPGAAPAVRHVGSARLENVPEIPAEISAAVQRYQNYRAASFQDWLADGSMLIATRFGATQQIHHVTAPGGARTQLTFSDEPASQAFAIPGSQRFLFSRDQGGDEWFQLYAAGLSGSPAQLTQAGTRNQAPVFSKDGRLVAWARAVKGSGEYTILVADPADPRSVRAVYTDARSLTPGDFSPDKSKLALTRDLSNRESQLLVLDLESGKVTEISAGSRAAFYFDPQYTDDGRRLLVISNRDSDFTRLLEIDVASRKASVLTEGLEWDIESFALSADGRVLAYVVNEDGYSRIMLRDFKTRRALPQPQIAGGLINKLKFSADGSKLGFDLSAATSAGDVWSLDVASGALTRWTTSELGELDPAQLAEPQLVRLRSFDGLSIPAFVYRPRGVAAQARTPVIIDIHGGPESQTRPSWNVGAQYFANTLGATVILPNVRGSTGYGKRYADLDNAERREDSVKDIGALLDWIGTQANLDSNRVAVYGQSYGGYMSLAVMTHYAKRLVGGVERYGISDFASFLENTEAYRRDNRRAEYGDERDPKMQEVFRRIAPLANVAKITRPMLVMQGANDPRVPQSESDQVVAGIRRTGAEVSYVVFADEGHGFLKKPNNDLRREVETVFLRRLFATE